MNVYNITLQANQQSFGAVNLSDEAKNVLKKRIKTCEDVENLQKLFSEQKRNKEVDISLYSLYKSNRLAADIKSKYPRSSFQKQTKKEFLSFILNKPVKFIESVCKKANAIASKVDSEIAKNDMIDKL